MKIRSKPVEMQKAASIWRGRGETVALVPTMGALHEAHATLIRRAARLADRVVVSAYVNPTQFNSQADFVAYPKRWKEDEKIAAEAGADLLFRPSSLYLKDASTWVEESDRSRGRCGAKRSGHFRGVATVVVKLLSIVQPNWIILGEKDGQQCEVLQRVVRDLFLPVKVVRWVKAPNYTALFSCSWDKTAKFWDTRSVQFCWSHMPQSVLKRETSSLSLLENLFALFLALTR